MTELSTRVAPSWMSVGRASAELNKAVCVVCNQSLVSGSQLSALSRSLFASAVSRISVEHSKSRHRKGISSVEQTVIVYWKSSCLNSGSQHVSLPHVISHQLHVIT